MNEENFSSSVESTTTSNEPNSSLPAEDDVQLHWQGVVKRRSFLKGISIAGATLAAGAMVGKLSAQTTHSSRQLSKGDTALLRFAAAAELIEADLWQQYNELGGVQGGNQAYIVALSNLDGDMPQYIADNTDDELSHAAFLNAYLISKGEDPVDLDAFRTLPSSQATGAKNIGRLTNLMKLNVDLSWYTRYRGTQNPDLGAKFRGPFHNSQSTSNTAERHGYTSESNPTRSSGHSARKSHASNRKHGRISLRLHRAGWCEPLSNVGLQGHRP